MKIKFLSTLVVILATAISCSNNNDLETKSSAQHVHPILGSWKGFFHSWESSEGKSGEGGIDWDLLFSEDSVSNLLYPYQFDQKSAYHIKDDSIWFPHKDVLKVYHWDIADSILTLTESLSNSNGESMLITKFKRSSFDENILQKIKMNGINCAHLENNYRTFDTENTKRYNWTEYDTNFYSPPGILNFDANDNYLISRNTVKFDKDTFYIVDLNDFFMLVEKRFKGDTIPLVYSLESTKNE